MSKHLIKVEYSKYSAVQYFFHGYLVGFMSAVSSKRKEGSSNVTLLMCVMFFRHLLSA